LAYLLLMPGDILPAAFPSAMLSGWTESMERLNPSLADRLDDAARR